MKTFTHFVKRADGNIYTLFFVKPTDFYKFWTFSGQIVSSFRFPFKSETACRHVFNLETRITLFPSSRLAETLYGYFLPSAVYLSYLGFFASFFVSFYPWLSLFAQSRRPLSSFHIKKFLRRSHVPFLWYFSYFQESVF